MNGLERFETARLLLLRPRPEDAAEIYSRYAGDPEVTRYMSFPTHRTVEDAQAFLAASDAEWARWSTGPYLIRLRTDNRLVGGTGLHFETPYRAMTGYILAKDMWGQGFATEALRGIIDVARSQGVRRLYAICHTDHERSWKVLERCGFLREATLRAHTLFPNHEQHQPQAVFSYTLIIDPIPGARR